MSGKAPGDADLGGMGQFDFSALQGVLNASAQVSSVIMQDPNIKNMAEQIAQDPAFAQMSAALQASMVNGGAEPGRSGAVPPIDPDQYANAMSSVLQNPQFMEMAEKLGQQIMTQDPAMEAMLRNMHNPEYRDNIGGKVEELKKDPEIGAILEEIQEGGPAAMMKYWSDPVALNKLSKAMGPAFGGEAVEGAEEGEEEEEEEDDEAVDTVFDAATSGKADALTELLEKGANKDEQDDEGRTALHFACGYGELQCAEVLLDAGANVDLVDNNKNTALHYAAGYGEVQSVALLLKYNIKLDAKNLDGKTAQEVAELNEQKEITDMLLKHSTEQDLQRLSVKA